FGWLGAVAYVQRERDGAQAVACDLGRRLLALRQDVGDDDGRAFERQPARNAEADPARGARYQRDSIIQSLRELQRFAPPNERSLRSARLPSPAAPAPPRDDESRRLQANRETRAARAYPRSGNPHESL